MKLKLFISIIFAILSFVLAYKISGRIAHGRDALPFSAPYMLSFQLSVANGTFYHTCGGSIINKYWALTAAHCFNFSNDTTKWEIKAGRHNIDSKSETSEQRRKIFYLKINEGYGGGAEPTDIALVRVNKPFIFNNAVRPIQLPASDVIHKENGTLFGWGLLNSDPVEFASILQTGIIPILSNQNCSEFFGNITHNRYNLEVTEANICAVDMMGISACSSDSGGPFVQFNNKTNVTEQLGIVSWGSECGQPNGKSVTVFTKVAYYVDWIIKVQKLYEERTN